MKKKKGRQKQKTNFYLFNFLLNQQLQFIELS